MPKRDERAYLHDMLSHAEEAVKLCSGHTIETFSADTVLRWAVIKLVEIVGEASIKTSEATRAQYAQIPWKELRGMRISSSMSTKELRTLSCLRPLSKNCLALLCH